MTPTTLTPALLADLDAKASASKPMLDDDTSMCAAHDYGDPGYSSEECEACRLLRSRDIAIAPDVVLALVEAARERDRLREALERVYDALLWPEQEEMKRSLDGVLWGKGK